jgi:hypothetical protein
MIWSFTHSISILCGMVWSPSFHRRSTKVHGVPSWSSSSITIYHFDIYIRHAGLKMKNTNIWLLPVVYNLQKGLLHTICKINNLTISHHMPCKNKLDVSNLSCIFYVVWGFLGRTILAYEHVTTMVIKILLTTLYKIYHNYSGRNVHPLSHIYRSMSSVGQVSWTQSHNVSLGQLQSHYATMIQKYKK